MPGPPETEVGYGRNWANVSNTPFREYKHWVHEGGIATPLVAHWPKWHQGQEPLVQGRPPTSSISWPPVIDLGKRKLP